MLYFCATALIMKYALPVFFIGHAPPLQQSPSDIVGVDLPEFAQQLFRPLIEQARQHEADFHDQVTAPPVAPGGHAAIPKPESLTRLRARRDAKPRRPLQRRNFDSGAERRL